MELTMKLRAIFLGSVGLFSGAVSAQSAHQHGVAELFFAGTGSELQIELHNPADNLLGFEHAPVNQQQRQTLQAAQQTVQQIEQLFVFNQAECELTHHDQTHLLCTFKPLYRRVCSLRNAAVFANGIANTGCKHYFGLGGGTVHFTDLLHCRCGTLLGAVC